MSRVLLESPLLLSAGLKHGFSTRHGGVSPPPWSSMNLGHGVGDDPARVRENRRRLEDLAGLERLFTLQQVHGGRVVTVRSDTDPCELEGHQGDALVAGTPNLALAVRTADCLPVLMSDPVAGVVAAVHAGWRGLVAGVIQAAVDAMMDPYGADPSRIVAALGPAIGACCFEVGGDVARAFTGLRAAVQSEYDGKWHVDLSAAARVILESRGVAGMRIDRVGGCTSCEAETFFSHRRDRGITGRHLSFIALPDPTR